jgi:hypothetical protein
MFVLSVVFCCSPTAAQNYKIALDPKEMLACVESAPWNMVRGTDFTEVEGTLTPSKSRIDDIHAAIMGCNALKLLKNSQAAADEPTGTVKQ